jgi:hypothetical protein
VKVEDTLGSIVLIYTHKAIISKSYLRSARQKGSRPSRTITPPSESRLITVMRTTVTR